jgi:prephenate dehydrogenase
MRIAIIGLGLIGGSLGLGLKKARPDLKIIGIPRREETIQQAITLGAIDEGTTDHIKGCTEADVIFVCTPIHLIVPIIREIAPHLKKGAIITDVGSSKYEIVSQAEKIMPKGVNFVGGHPMAGKEKPKLEAAEADLFKDKVWILTKTSKTSSKALTELKNLITALGGKTEEMDPKTHDLVVAAISHLPLALAVSLVNTVAEHPEKDLMVKCAASGFRDTTRIASGDPILGVDMFTTNRSSILKIISFFKKTLTRLEKSIKEENGEKIKEELVKAKIFRDSIQGI